MPPTPGWEDRAALAALTDTLLPGEGDWPAASAAIADPGEILERLDAGDREMLAGRSADLPGLEPEAQVAAVTRWEAEDGAGFGRVLAAVYQAYYNSAGPLAAVRRLAEAGPREPSPYFDPSLLETVIATQAGRRRL